MSLLNLLNLPEDEIDTVTTVVQDRCSAHHVPVDSEIGRKAMSEAVRLSVAGEKSQKILYEGLCTSMRINQRGRACSAPAKGRSLRRISGGRAHSIRK